MIGDEHNLAYFLAYFKVPTHIQIKSGLPMTVTGKPQKFVMRGQMEKELAAAE